MSALLDTSVVVRYLHGAESERAKRAAAIIEHEPDLIIHEVVLTETAHVLERLYGVERQKVADALIALLRRNNIKGAGLTKDDMIQALLLYKPSGRVSLPDALLWAAAKRFPDPVVYSFDERFPKEGIEIRR